MTEKEYKIIADNLGEYSVLRPNGSIVSTEIKNKAEAELFCDELNKLLKENEELISIKRFADRHGINIFNIDEAFRRCWNDNGDLVKENQKLKTQLLHGDGVCDICKHEYLVKTGKYYVSKCKKGHEECSKIDLAYCGDFEVKECKE